MKHADKIAYEDEGSTTRRFTPEELGHLLTKCNPEQLIRIRDTYNKHMIMYMPMGKRDVIASILEKWAYIIRPR